MLIYKKDFALNGIPCIHYGQIYTQYLFIDIVFAFVNTECVQRQKKTLQNNIILAVTSENIEDVCKCVAWLGTKPVAVSGYMAIIHCMPKLMRLLLKLRRRNE